MFRACGIALVLFLPAFSQTSTPGSIQAIGSATINGIAPDQVQLTVGVITSATTAQAAASQNSAAASAMIAALQNVLGTGGGTVQTINYSLYPQYSGSIGNMPPTITGYTASNTVQVTTGKLNLVGQLIDAANGAGANNISGPSYSLQDGDPYRQQALTAAAKQALAHAAAIAAGLGAKTGAVISAQESSSVMPIVYAGTLAASSATPIETGTVSVSASVTVTVALQ